LPLQYAVQRMAGVRLALPSEGAALLGGAGAIARGTIERSPANGALRLHLDVFESATHRLLASGSSEQADPYLAAAEVARALNPKAMPNLGNRNPATPELWAAALNSTSPAQMVETCTKLLDADPGFSPSYVSCALVLIGPGAMSRVDRRAVADRAYATKDILTPDALNIAGQMLFQSGRFEQASETMTRVAATIPAAWNQVGYSQAMLGNTDAARKALEDYRKFGGDEANAVDSLGEVHYITGKYAEAEKYFLECGDKFPQTIQGRTAKLKAAAMRALQGNRGGAEELAQSMFTPLRTAGQDIKSLEELWRGVILEQDPQAMRKKIENGMIAVPARE
jgi:tetratricopeptide (TPR) repeat protein